MRLAAAFLLVAVCDARTYSTYGGGYGHAYGHGYVTSYAAPKTYDQDCKVSDWSSWGHCSKNCGGGTYYRSRSVLYAQAGNGQPCPSLTASAPCNQRPCKINCAVSHWAGWGPCSENCGPGVMYSTRTIITQPAYGGKTCPHLKAEKNCQDKPCPIDCVGTLGGWGDCSATCGGGYKTRSPMIQVKAAYGGKKCPTAESAVCNTDYCPVDCAFKWRLWGDCSASCGGGTQSRTPNVRTAPANGGKACPAPQTRSCRTEECPVDCQYEWGDWGDCDKSCGGGYKRRGPVVSISAAYGGTACPPRETSYCNTDYCAVDCKYEWGDWSDCSVSCGGGYKTRYPIQGVKAAYGGQNCPEKQQQYCNTDYCPVDCDYTWGNWGDCDKSCGAGTMYRTPAIAVNNQYGGSPCPDAESKSCFLEYCPVDCEYEWGDWGGCSKTCGGGLRIRTPLSNVTAAYNGKACPPSEEMVCSTDACPVDCQYEWGDWGDCDKSCGGGKQYRLPNVAVKHAHGGTPCPDEQTKYCGTEYCPVDCVYEWGNWSDCTKSCGSGSRGRVPTVAVPAAYGGVACPDPKQEYCNTDYCPVDCDYAWGEWSACSATCGGGYKTRSPTASVSAAYGGKPCPPSEKQACNTDYCSVDCNYVWGEWSDCTVSCGGGLQYRTADVAITQDYGGTPCPHSESKDCNTDYCAGDCDYTWGAWGDCSATCGGGYHTRKPVVKYAAAYGGDPCPSEDKEPCNAQSCPVDCETSDWDDWSACSQKCDKGDRSRERTVTQAALYGGVTCPHLYEETDCYPGNCAVDCKYEWGDWSDCSVSCGGGQAYRKPQVSKQPSEGVDKAYVPCPNTDYKGCNDYDCAVDCAVSDWGGWTDCSEKCGEGYQTNKREVTVAPEYGGKVCPALHDERDCTYGPCPVDCEHEWGPWGVCTVTCGGGYSTRKARISQAPKYGGKACPAPERMACATDYCAPSYPTLRLYLKAAPIKAKASAYMQDGSLSQQQQAASSSRTVPSSSSASLFASAEAVCAAMLGLLVIAVVLRRRAVRQRDVDISLQPDADVAATGITAPIATL